LPIKHTSPTNNTTSAMQDKKLNLSNQGEAANNDSSYSDLSENGELDKLIALMSNSILRKSNAKSTYQILEKDNEKITVQLPAPVRYCRRQRNDNLSKKCTANMSEPEASVFNE
jgi:hypothetical protein